MKCFIFIAAGFATLISGCASTQLLADDDGIDHQKVATINSVARARGVEIHWLNYPQRRSRPTDAAPTVDKPSGS